ncbi:MAG TPA: thioredoxin family protein [Methylomirabilota bacterium]|nr:thioredoxin family protein [Methylomirabilota bacterium]
MASTRVTRRRFLTDSALGALAAAGAGALVTPGIAGANAPAKVGTAAPAFSLPTTGGGSQSLADLKGKIVVLEWTNHECPYVRKHYESGNMQGLQREATGQGVVWLSIVSSAPGTQGYVTAPQADELTTSRKAAPTAVLLDPKGTVGRLYGATNTPHMYVIDKAGVLAYAGAIDDRPTSRKSDVQGANNYVRAALQSVAAGEPVKTPVTRAYGCTVKYA